jgi:hypothetical protein
MRSITALVFALLATAIPVPAFAGTYTVPFGNGTPMSASGWIPNAQAGPICGFEGVGTLWLNAGTLPAHNGCFYLFNAPAAAQIVAVNVSHGFAKASAATALCTYSFAAQPGDTLRHCSGGSFGDAIATSGANWVELGLYNESALGIAIATARANNAVYAGGFVTLSDPTPPAVWANGPTGVQAGLSAVLDFAGSDAESGAPSMSYSVDGGAPVGLSAQVCSWLCGTLVSGSVALDLAPLPDGPHSVTVSARSYADAPSSFGPFAFTVDRTAPAQPQLHVVPDAAAATAGWWGHAPVALSVSTATAPDVVSSVLRVYGPSGGLVYDLAVAGAMTSAAIPAAALTAGGTYELDVVECDVAGHCATSSRSALRWDGSPPPAPVDATAAPLGLLAARDGAHMTWPAQGAPGGGSGIAGAFTGVGPTPEAARAQALSDADWDAGVPGTSDTAIPATAVRGAEQVCLAIRPVSGAGLAAGSAGVRCALVDELPPAVAVSGALRWSGGAQTVGLAVSDANGAAFSQVLLDGAAMAVAGGAITIAGEGAHMLRAVAQDGAGNETVVERALGVDATAPVIGSVTADFVAREVRVGVTDALAGVARAEVRLGGTALETRIAADGATAIARVPAGLVLDGAAVSVRVLDASSPANAGERSASLPERTRPLLRGLSVGRSRVSGRVVADAASRVRVWAYPKGRVAHLVGTYATRAGGTFSVRVRPGRTTRYAVGVPETQQLRSLSERVAGTVRVTARISALTVRVRGDGLAVRARFAGRGEATRLHLLVHDVRGGRWVEACLEHGRPGVRLERTGRVWGTCRIPPSARGRAWTYRLVLAAPSSTWPWSTPSSGSVSVLLPL